jgi:hypothetical protein
MTITVPWRRITLQLSQRAFTEARTFNGPSIRVLKPIGDAAPGEVVRGELDPNPVARQDPDEVHPELPADVREDAMAVLELDREHGVRQRLDHGTFDFDRVLLAHGLPCFPLTGARIPAGPGGHANA